MLKSSLERPPVDSQINKQLIDTLGLQLEACLEAAKYAIKMTYLLFSESYYLSEHGAWVDLKMKPGENETVYRNRVYARMRMERNTLNSIKAIVSDYTEEATVQDMMHPSCSFILGVSKLGSKARLFKYNMTVKGVLITIPDDLTIAEIRAMLEDLETVKEAAVRLFILQEGKGIVLSTGGIGEGITLSPTALPPNPDSSNQGGSTTPPPTSTLPDPTKDYLLYPTTVDSSGVIIGSTLNKTTTIFGVGVETSDIIP